VASRHPRGARPYARTPPAYAPARAPILPFALASVIVLAGCGSSGQDLASKPAAAILAASRTAARNASAVHVVSEIFDGKTKDRPVYTLELQLTHERGRGRVSLLGHQSEVIRIENTLYAKGSPAFYRRLAQRTGAHLAPGTWVKTPANGTQLTEFAALTEPDGELTLLLRDPTISLTNGHTITIDGQRAIALQETGKLYTGIIYIAATGTPYPIEIVKHGRETSTTTFTRWNQPATLSAPANAVELSTLERG
jgi:hypothetical protein